MSAVYFLQKYCTINYHQCGCIYKSHRALYTPSFYLLLLNAFIPHLNTLSSYLNYLRFGAYEAAVDVLHQYFDYRHSDGFSMDSNGAEIKLHHYVSLNFAILEVKFGHYREAKVALKECMTMASSSHDQVCIDYAKKLVTPDESHFPTNQFDESH